MPLSARAATPGKDRLMRSSPTATGPRPIASASAETGGTVACPHCRVVSMWGALARVQVLEGAVLESHLAVRPDGWFVDVRACAGCGRGFARKVRAQRT